MRETSYDFDLAGPGVPPEGDRHANAAHLQMRIEEMRRLLNMLENAISLESGTCDRFQANAVFARIRVELVQIKLLLSSLPGR